MSIIKVAERFTLGSSALLLYPQKKLRLNNDLVHRSEKSLMDSLNM
jgi:hypothetical protein